VDEKRWIIEVPQQTVVNGYNCQMGGSSWISLWQIVAQPFNSKVFTATVLERNMLSCNLRLHTEVGETFDRLSFCHFVV
jgi:hypothetical protein